MAPGLMRVRNVMTPFMAPGVDTRTGRDDVINGPSAIDTGLNIGRTPRADAQCSLLLLMEFSPP